MLQSPTGKERAPVLDDFPVEFLPARACTSCEEPLPRELDTRDAHILAVVGINGSGKTNYLTVALTEATRRQALTPIGCTEFAGDDVTARRFYKDFYVPLYRERLVHDGTQSDGRLQADPLTFRVSFSDSRPMLVMTQDISGEVLTDHRRRARVTAYLRRASAVIFLVDPLEFDFVRENLPLGFPVPQARDIHQADLLESTLRELKYMPGGRDVPVAVVVSKSDLVWDVLASSIGVDALLTEVLQPPRALCSPVGSVETALDPGSWVGDVQRASVAVRKLLLAYGEAELVANADKHSQVTYHAVSALGAAPSEGRIDRLRPFACIEPLATVLYRLSIAMARR
jgi:hypothetical protein